MQPVIEFASVSKAYYKGDTCVTALSEVSTSVERGELLAIVGPSGCGKSTLLNLAAGLMKPGRGSVRYDGAPVKSINTHVSYMTQRDNLLPWRTVAGNLRLPLELAGRRVRLNRAAARERVAQVIKVVGLEGFEQHYPSQLSGGMRKRTQLGQALITDPEVLLMDEPFGALDAQLKLVLQSDLLKAWEGSQRTLVFVTHDLSEAITLADRVIVMSARPGQIKLEQAIDIPRPRDVFTVRFHPLFGEYFEILWKALRDDIEGSR